MAEKVQGTFYTGQRLRRGATPVSPGELGEDGQPYPTNPVNVGTFISLLDTPNGYAGQKGKVPKVNEAENGLEFSSAESGVGIKLNGQVIGGVKKLIESSETLLIPIYWEYNIHGVSLDIDGVIENNGNINIG